MIYLEDSFTVFNDTYMAVIYNDNIVKLIEHCSDRLLNLSVTK
jgi:hypothetical protein